MSEGGNFVAFADGPGILPVLPVVETLLGRNAKAHVRVFYGNTDREQAEGAEALLALKDRYLDRLALHFVMSDEPQEIELLNGRLDAAKIAAVAGKLFEPGSVRQFIICGPDKMSGEVNGALQKLGVPPAHIHVEPYAAGVASESSASQNGSAAAAEGVTEVAVIMDGRRRTFTMQTHGGTLLEAAAQAGVDLPFSCRAGVCSTCRTKLLRGQVEMAQNYALEDWELEQGFILACQSHPKTPELEITYDET